MDDANLDSSGPVIGPSPSGSKGSNARTVASPASLLPLVEKDATVHTIEFLETRFAADQVIELTAVAVGGGRVSICGRLGEPRERADIVAFIDRHNGRANLYYGVNPRPLSFAGTDRVASAEHVEFRNTIPWDFDLPDEISPSDHAARKAWQDRIVELLEPLAPVLTCSGYGIHALFDIHPQGRDAPDLRRAISNLAGLIGADPSVCDVPRIMRVPHTVNLPTDSKKRKGREKARAYPLEAGADGVARRWDPQELFAALKLIAPQFPGYNPEAETKHTPSAARSQRVERAPSLALFTEAVKALPNGPEFKDYNGHFIRGTFALTGAVVGTPFEREGLEMVGEWQGRYGGDPELDERARDDARRKTKTGWRHVLQMLHELDATTAARLTNATAAAGFAARPVSDGDERELMERKGAAKQAPLKMRLAELNQRFAHVLTPGMIIEFPLSAGSRAPYQAISRQAFLDHFPDPFFLPGSRKPKGLGSIWLGSVNKRSFDSIGLWLPHAAPKNSLNLFRETPVDTSIERSVRQALLDSVSDWPLLREFLITVVAHGNMVFYEHFLDWVAFQMQRPLQKTEVVIVLLGKQGVGKSFLMGLIADLFHPSQTLTISHDRQAIGNFNAHLEGKVFVRLEEALFGRDPRHRGPYKDLITNRTMIIEHKGVDSYTADNLINVMVATNSVTPVSVEADDRRHSVTRLSSAHRNDKAYFQAIEDEWVSGGRAAFLRDLRARRLSDAVSMVGIATPEKAEIAEASGGMASLYWRSVLDRGSLPGLWSHNWVQEGAFVTYHAVAADYSDFTRQAGVRTPMSNAELARSIIDLCPRATEHRIGGKRGLAIPSLAVCLAAYDAAMGADN